MKKKTCREQELIYGWKWLQHIFQKHYFKQYVNNIKNSEKKLSGYTDKMNEKQSWYYDNG